MKKKFVSIVLAALMVISLTTGCGESEPDAADFTPVPASNQGTGNQGGAAGNDGAGDQQETPTSEPDAPQQTVVLDYDKLDEWIYGGWMGTSTSGEGVLLATNAEYDYGILFFTDDSSMAAVSFMGPFETDYNEHMKISDEVNGLSITMLVTETGDGEIQLDMGDLGVATVSIQTKPITMKRIQEIIEKYTQVA